MNIINIKLKPNVEYLYETPLGAKRIILKLRNEKTPFQISYQVGTSDSKYITVPAGKEKCIDNPKGVVTTIYFQVKGKSQIIEIETCK